jgi:hypothetical protein
MQMSEVKTRDRRAPAYEVELMAAVSRGMEDVVRLLLGWEEVDAPHADCCNGDALYLAAMDNVNNWNLQVNRLSNIIHHDIKGQLPTQPIPSPPQKLNPKTYGDRQQSAIPIPKLIGETFSHPQCC